MAEPAVQLECAHDHVAVYARKLIERGLSDCEHICSDCGHRWWSEGVAPQEGPQTAFFESVADITFYGGGAGTGKSDAAVKRHLRYVHDPKYTGIIFRRKSTELQGGGSVWETTLEHYPRFGGVANLTKLSWVFPSGATVKLSHLQHEGDVHGHQSKAYAGETFEELTQFARSQFWYMRSRNRSISGVDPFMDATMNPVPKTDPVGGWVREMIDWYIDADGYAIPERSGVLRYFYRVDDVLDWDSDRQALIDRHPEMVDRKGKQVPPTSFTFISATLDDNPILKTSDPGYEKSLMSLPRVERERLLKGNWNIAPSAGLYFQQAWFRVIEAEPVDLVDVVRAWDKAASEPTPENPDPNWSVGVKMGVRSNGRIVVLHMEATRGSPHKVDTVQKNTASNDGVRVRIGIWQDPGQAGVVDVQHTKALLMGYHVESEVARENKLVYAGPFSTQVEAGNVDVVRGPWNEMFFAMLVAFPDGKHKDVADACSRAFMMLHNSAVVAYQAAMDAIAAELGT